jgi:hypothetical protein
MDPGLVSDAREVSTIPAQLLLMTLSVDSIAGMKATLPGLKSKLYSDPAYFKKVYMHTFDLAKAAGARTLALETGRSPSLAPGAELTYLQHSQCGRYTFPQH